MKNIRKYRLAAGLTQGQLAVQINKSVGCISQYESGIHSPPIPVAKKMAKILGCEWTELYDEEG